jgi:hypothetical protein
MDYAEYQHLTFDHRPSGVVLVAINIREKRPPSFPSAP